MRKTLISSRWIRKILLSLPYTDPPPQSMITRLKAGDIIVSGTHRKLPTGFLRRVESVDHSDDLVIVRTTNAKLSDAIEQC
jgi:hypothetical protein